MMVLDSDFSFWPPCIGLSRVKMNELCMWSIMRKLMHSAAILRKFLQRKRLLYQRQSVICTELRQIATALHSSRISRRASAAADAGDGGLRRVRDAEAPMVSVTCAPPPTQWSDATIGHLLSRYSASRRRPRETPPPTTTTRPTAAEPRRCHPSQRPSPAGSERVPDASRDVRDSSGRGNIAARKCPEAKNARLVPARKRQGMGVSWQLRVI